MATSARVPERSVHAAAGGERRRQHGTQGRYGGESKSNRLDQGGVVGRWRLQRVRALAVPSLGAAEPAWSSPAPRAGWRLFQGPQQAGRFGRGESGADRRDPARTNGGPLSLLGGAAAGGAAQAR